MDRKSKQLELQDTPNKSTDVSPMVREKMVTPVPQRLIVPNISGASRIKFCGNEIKTSRYTWYSFLPISILLQFTKLGNVFWAFVAFLNFFPAIRVNSPWAVVIVLTVIVSLGVMKEGITDYMRNASDKRINNILCQKISTFDKKLTQVQLRDVHVGDILVLSDGETVPADCVLLEVN